MTDLFFESVSSQAIFISASAVRAWSTPLKKSSFFALSPFSAWFSPFAIWCVDFQNGLFFAVAGSSPLSARADLTIAASAFFESATNCAAVTFLPLGFLASAASLFGLLAAAAANERAGAITRESATTDMERQITRRTKFLMSGESVGREAIGTSFSSRVIALPATSLIPSSAER